MYTVFIKVCNKKCIEVTRMKKFYEHKKTKLANLIESEKWWHSKIKVWAYESA